MFAWDKRSTLLRESVNGEQNILFDWNLVKLRSSFSALMFPLASYKKIMKTAFHWHISNNHVRIKL